MSRFCNSAVMAALAILFLTSPLTSWAAPADYRFELVGQPEKTGAGTLVNVRLVTVADEKPVGGIEIVESRLDMGPDGMPTMTAPVNPLPASESDVYAFEAHPTMAGNWALTVSAKIKGEADLVSGAVTVTVAK